MSSSPPTVKKKRCLWSEENLVTAMSAVIKGELSQRQAAAQYNIPRRTLRNHLKSGKSVKEIGRAPTLSKSQEKDLVERIIKFSKIGTPLTPQVIRTQAYKFCEKQGIENNFNKKTGRAGRDWFKMFMKRNPNISMRKAQLMNPARAQKLNKFIVQDHFQKVKNLYDELDIPNHPERLYNIDEKGCRLTIHHQQKVLAEKGNRRVHMVAPEHGENVSIAMCVNATGNAIPPMIIFKGKRLKEELKDNLPPGTLVKMAAKGSMTTSLFIDFIDHLGQYKSPGKCLLIFDGASCHLDYDIVDVAEKHDIVLYCLPSNTTHELQPLDKSVNKSFENYWDQEVVKFMYHNPTKKINKTRFNPIFTKVWSKCMTPENILNGFRATGLFPLDPSAIPEDAFAPSLLTENQNPNLPGRAPCTSTRVIPFFDKPVVDGSRPLVNDSDTDITDVEDMLPIMDPRSNVDSPSLLSTPLIMSPAPMLSESNIQQVPRDGTPRMVPTDSKLRLVDYSSSLDLESENEETINKSAAYESPVPGPSGIRVCRPIAHDISSNSSDESLEIEDLIRVQNRRNVNIYDPYSDSTDDCVNFIEHTPQKLGDVGGGEQTPNKTGHNIVSGIIQTSKELSDDPEEDIPLIELKQKVTSKTSFKELIPTPNYKIVKTQSRRKALNYKGQRIVKDLFEKKQESTRIHKNKEHKKVKKYLTKPKNTKIRKQASYHVKNISSKDMSDKWFCYGCKLEREEDMRRCKKCAKWYHEECVGLTKEDNEDFFCPDCV